MTSTTQTALNFAQASEGVEAVIMRIGAHSTQVVFLAASGEWSRAVVASPEAGRALCERLGLACHDGWSDALRGRAAAWRPSPAAWAAHPYPER